MKFLLYLLLLSSTFAYSRGLDQLTIPQLRVTKAPLTKVLHKIISYSKYQPLIDQNIQGITSLNLNKVSFKKALQTISKIHNLQVSYMGQAIIITKKEKRAPAKNKVVKVQSPLPSFKAEIQSNDPRLQKIKKSFAFPPRVRIKRDHSLSQSEEVELQKVLKQFSPKAKKLASSKAYVKQTQLLGTTKAGNEFTAIIRYKGEERLCQIGSQLDQNVVVKKVFEKHLIAFDTIQNKEIVISF
jgi:hypothetical protein